MTIRTREELAAVAERIRNETNKKENTTERVGGLLADIVDTALLASPTTEIHVNLDTGNDETGTGAEGAPYATTARAAQDIPFECDGVTVYVHSSATRYPPPVELFAPRSYKGAGLRVVGLGGTVVAGPFTLSAEPTYPNLTYSFSGSPGWTPNAWIGYSLECLTSANAGLVGMKKHISKNITSATMCMLWAHEQFPDYALPQTGDTFQIVTPGVMFDADTGAGEGPLAVHCGPSKLTVFDYAPRRDAVTLENCEFYFPADSVQDSMQFVGGVELIGVDFSSAGSGNKVVQFHDGGVRAGAYVNEATYDVDRFVYGWGIATRSRDGNRRPEVHFRGCNGNAYHAGGHVKVHQGGIWFPGSTMHVIGSSSMVEGTKSSCLEVFHGSAHFSLSHSGGFTNNFISTAAATTDIFANEGGKAVVGSSHFHLGVGSIFECWWGGVGYIQNSTPTLEAVSGVTGSGTTPTTNDMNRCVAGGRLGIQSTTATTLGSVAAGWPTGSQQNTRATVGWNVGDSCVWTDGSDIRRY